jgi:hypothetical protein
MNVWNQRCIASKCCAGAALHEHVALELHRINGLHQSCIAGKQLAISYIFLAFLFNAVRR